MSYALPDILEIEIPDDIQRNLDLLNPKNSTQRLVLLHSLSVENLVRHVYHSASLREEVVKNDLLWNKAWTHLKVTSNVETLSLFIGPPPYEISSHLLRTFILGRSIDALIGLQVQTIVRNLVWVHPALTILKNINKTVQEQHYCQCIFEGYENYAPAHSLLDCNPWGNYNDPRLICPLILLVEGLQGESSAKIVWAWVQEILSLKNRALDKLKNFKMSCIVKFLYIKLQKEPSKKNILSLLTSALHYGELVFIKNPSPLSESSTPGIEYLPTFLDASERRASPPIQSPPLTPGYPRGMEAPIIWPPSNIYEHNEFTAFIE